MTPAPPQKMAGRRQAFQSNPELQRFLLSDVRTTGKKLGVGSYGSVEELEMNDLVCAGKRIHEALLERDNDGVTNIERKYLEECQVMAADSLQVKKLQVFQLMFFDTGNGSDSAS